VDHGPDPDAWPGPWRGPWRAGGRRPVPLILVLALQGGLSLWTAAHGSPALAVEYAACAVAGASALLLLRRHPGPAVLLVAAASLAGLLLIPAPPFALLPFLVAVVVATVRGARGWAIGAACGALLLPVAQFVLTSDPILAVRSLGEALLLLAAVAIGEGLRIRFLRMRDAAAARADRRRIAAEQERVRIARELHDVLAHSLSSITVQAGVGLHLAGTRPEAATEALETIRATSKEALAEVRSVLGVLRGDEQAPRRPEPDVDAIALLVEDARRSGGRIGLTDGLQPRPAPRVQLALYRIVQESLTNARRHAPGAAVDVELAWAGRSAVARIRDTGGGSGADAAPFEPGNGILGMRERADLLGGVLEIRRDGGGTVVEARIPGRDGAEP
jgi:signal transduction histidine kinase